VDANSTAIITEDKYSSHSESGNMNKPVRQVDNRSSMTTTHARTRTAAASQEFMEENGPERAIHPPCSQHLSPSDFYLVSHMKHCLRGQSFETANELLFAIDTVLKDINKWPLHAAFLDWIQRLGNVLKPVVTILRELRKISRATQSHAADIEMLMVR
jgi:hypothetical protein